MLSQDNFGVFRGLLGPNWAIFEVRGRLKKTALSSTHVAEQLLFSMFPSILTFDFALNLGSFLTFWGSNGLFWGQGGAQ